MMREESNEYRDEKYNDNSGAIRSSVYSFTIWTLSPSIHRLSKYIKIHACSIFQH
jgi:hypothetical protein